MNPSPRPGGLRDACSGAARRAGQYPGGEDQSENDDQPETARDLIRITHGKFLMKKSSTPSHLSADGKRMFRELHSDYAIDDAAGFALLQAACEAFDRSQQARRRIDRDGAVLTDRFGQRKAHPACAIERDARGQMISALRALKLAPAEEA